MALRTSSPSPPAAVVSCLMERRTIAGSLQKQFLVRWVGEAQSDSWHAIDAFIWRPEDLEALSRRGGFARLEDDPWCPIDLKTTEGTIASILRQKGAAAEEARAAAEAKAAELAAARAAKEKHQLANVHDVVPMVMEREEVRNEAEEAEEARKLAAARKEAEEARKVAAAREEAEEARKVAAARKEARERRSSHFRGPCKDFCKQRCSCCASADGTTLYVPIARSGYRTDYLTRAPLTSAFTYELPLCLHMCLCPQQGGDPCPVYGAEIDRMCAFPKCYDRFSTGGLQLLCANPFLSCWQNFPVPPNFTGERRIRTRSLVRTRLFPAPLDGLPLADSPRTDAASVCALHSYISSAAGSGVGRFLLFHIPFRFPFLLCEMWFPVGSVSLRGVT